MVTWHWTLYHCPREVLEELPPNYITIRCRWSVFSQVVAAPGSSQLQDFANGPEFPSLPKWGYSLGRPGPPDPGSHFHLIPFLVPRGVTSWPSLFFYALLATQTPARPQAPGLATTHHCRHTGTEYISHKILPPYVGTIPVKT